MRAWVGGWEGAGGAGVAWGRGAFAYRALERHPRPGTPTPPTRPAPPTSFGYLTIHGFCDGCSCVTFPVIFGETGSRFYAEDARMLADFAIYMTTATAGHAAEPNMVWWCWNANSGGTGGLVQDNWIDVRLCGWCGWAVGEKAGGGPAGGRRGAASCTRRGSAHSQLPRRRPRTSLHPLQVDWTKITWLESASYLNPWWRTTTGQALPPQPTPPPPDPSPPPPALTTAWTQAEDAVLTGVTVATLVPSYQGTGYVDGASFAQAGDTILFAFVPDVTGEQTLLIRYSIPEGAGDKVAGVRVNSGPVVPTTFPNTGGGWAVLPVSATLVPGPNTVAMTADWG